MKTEMEFQCPHCKTSLVLPPEFAEPGEVVECPDCQKDVIVPRPHNAPIPRQPLVDSKFKGPYFTVHFDIAKLPSGTDTNHFLVLFWKLFSLESITQLRILAGRLAKDPGCFSIVLQTNHAMIGQETGFPVDSPETKLIGDRFVRFRDNPPVSELTCVIWSNEDHKLPLIALVDRAGSIRFADALVEDQYRTAKSATAAASTQINLDPRWKRVLDSFGQYISISGSPSKIPVDGKLYPRIRLHTFFRDYAHADQVLGRIPNEIMTLQPVSEGLSPLSGEVKYHVTHEGNLTGRQIKEYLQIIVEGGGGIWEALL